MLLDLGSALLKASRLAALPSGVASSFCDGAPIATRVERLLSDPPGAAQAADDAVGPVGLRAGHAGRGAFLAAPALQAAYAITESVVHLLR